MADRVIIEHPDGRAYSVTEADHAKLYADEGFAIVRNDDGTEYTGAGAEKGRRLQAASQKRIREADEALAGTPAEGSSE